MRRFITLLFAVLVPCTMLHAAKPNILVLFADDLGNSGVGYQEGAEKEIKTPNIDSIAANGVRCTAGYVTAPQCSPSRAGLISGRYQQRFGHEENHNQPVMLMKGGKTIGDQFKAAGYATGHFGKWHLGYETREQAPKEFVEKGDWMAPTQHGFDESFGFHDLEKPAPDPKRKRQPKQAQDDRVFARKTADFIERHKDKPWCVYLAFHAPHGPHTSERKYTSKFADAPKDRRGALAAMALLDDAVGIVLTKLRELNTEEDTLIFFIGDNGGTRYEGRSVKRWQQGTENKPFRGGKGNSIEGGIRVPYLVQWKGHLPAGKTYDRPVISLDVIPTALGAAGATPLADYELDGVNLLPFFKGEKTPDPHEALYWRWRREQAVRSGDWKLVRSEDKHFGHKGWALIDLKTDIRERTDLTAKHPEIAKELQQRRNSWNASHPPIGPEFKSDETEE